jgi:hypothetical protein
MKIVQIDPIEDSIQEKIQLAYDKVRDISGLPAEFEQALKRARYDGLFRTTTTPFNLAINIQSMLYKQLLDLLPPTTLVIWGFKWSLSNECHRPSKSRFDPLSMYLHLDTDPPCVQRSKLTTEIYRWFTTSKTMMISLVDWKKGQCTIRQTRYARINCLAFYTTAVTLIWWACLADNSLLDFGIGVTQTYRYRVFGERFWEIPAMLLECKG